MRPVGHITLKGVR